MRVRYRRRPELTSLNHHAVSGHLGWQWAVVGALHCDSPAVTNGSDVWSYGHLVAAARAIAGGLLTHPTFAPGARVVSLLPNCAEYIAVFYGVLLAGGVIVPLPPKTESGVLQQVLQSTEPTFVVTRSQIIQSRSDLHALPVEILELSQRIVEDFPDPAGPTVMTGKDLAAVFFTAGSTGNPKGVMLSHENLISNASAIQQYLGIRADDRALCVLPFHHAFGNSVLQSHLLAGAHLILDGQTVFPETIVQALQKHACTSFSAVPDLYRSLLERSSLGTTDLPALRYMAVAGGALRHELAVDVARRIAPAEFFVMYGQTEATARLAYVPPSHLPELAAGTIGRAIPGANLQIVDEQGRPVAPGEVGELRAQGPGIMLGYWRDPAATGERIRDGWLYTGDLATLDSQGWIIHKGRRQCTRQDRRLSRAPR